MKKKFVIIYGATSLLLFAGALVLHAPRPALPLERITIDGVTYTVEVAATPAEQQLGLSDRSSMPPDRGMLFVFSAPGIQAFWMKDMHFPLDIVWLRAGHIVDIKKNLPPEGRQPEKVYRPTALSDAVLEISAGEADKHGFKIQDAAIIQ